MCDISYEIKKFPSAELLGKNCRFEINLISLPGGLLDESFYERVPSICRWWCIYYPDTSKARAFFLKLKMTFHDEEVQIFTLIQIKINFNNPHTNGALIKPTVAAEHQHRRT